MDRVALANVPQKKIQSIAIVDGIDIQFEDGSLLHIMQSQDCCENRYARTEDDLTYFAGATLLGVEVRDTVEEITPSQLGEDYHEVQFMIVHTSKGDITIANHNEHNGYYGGFTIEAFISNKKE